MLFARVCACVRACIETIPDLCKKCYDAGINPARTLAFPLRLALSAAITCLTTSVLPFGRARGADLPVSPSHEKDHGFRVLQTRGFGAQGYLVDPSILFSHTR
jgi:hypothetical protein